MAWHASPFFWALVALLGLHVATLAVSGHRAGRRVPAVLLALTLLTAGRIVLPLCPQPRLGLGPWRWAAGGLVVLAALAIAAPALSVKWWRPPAPGMRLCTTGVYSLVRHPIYLAEVLWPLGWSVMWGSTYGVALTPLWWVAFLLHAVAEEDRLEEVLGAEYAEYKGRVRGRLLPGLPV